MSIEGSTHTLEEGPLRELVSQRGRQRLPETSAAPDKTAASVAQDVKAIKEATE